MKTKISKNSQKIEESTWKYEPENVIFDQEVMKEIMKGDIYYEFMKKDMTER